MKLVILSITDAAATIPGPNEEPGFIDLRRASGVADVVNIELIRAWAQRCGHELLDVQILITVGRESVPNDVVQNIVNQAAAVDCDGVVTATLLPIQEHRLITLVDELNRIDRPLYDAEHDCQEQITKETRF